jgi:hypothetical protein
LPPSPTSKRLETDDDEPWKQTVLDHESDPWARLNRDFPPETLPSFPAPVRPMRAEYPDLLSVGYWGNLTFWLYLIVAACLEIY